MGCGLNLKMLPPGLNQCPQGSNLPMKKNEIYIKMLALALPHIRNIQTHDEFEKGRDMSCYF